VRTRVDGVMVAGDRRSKKVRQVINADGEGAVAAIAAYYYFNKLDLI